MSSQQTLSLNTFSSAGNPGLAPRTAFAIFRSDYLANQYKLLCSRRTIANSPNGDAPSTPSENAVNIALGQAGAAKEAGIVWDNMSAEDQKRWQDMAFEEMRDFRRNSPDYVAEQKTRIAEKGRRNDKRASPKARVVFAVGMGGANAGLSGPPELATPDAHRGPLHGLACSVVERVEDELRYIRDGLADALDESDFASCTSSTPIAGYEQPQSDGYGYSEVYRYWS